MQQKNVTVDKISLVLDWIITTFALSGAGVMSQGLWEGYWLLLVANIAGLFLWSRLRLWPSLLRNIIFLIFNVIGIHQTLL